MPNWTQAQQNAINADGSNILVSAAAGSGKTAVLVERVIRLITDESLNVDIDRLLVVTFTNAAASEMKTRISRSLDELISKEPNNSNALKQRSLLPNAKICTIDSFCINLVREYFFRLNISQDFTILEETQKAVIEQNVIDEIIERLYAEEDESFKALVELLSTTKSDSDLINAVKRLDNYITSQPFPFDWLDEMCELYNPSVDIDGSKLMQYAISELNYAVKFILRVIDNSLSVLYPEDELFDKYSEMLNSDRAVFEKLCSVTDSKWDDIREALFNLSFSRMPSKRGYESEVKSIISESRKLYSGVKSIIATDILPLFSPTSDDIKEDNKFLYPILKQLVKLVKEFHERCFEIKKELNAYTFSDIEHFAIELLFSKDENGNLVRSDIANEYERNFYEILVDEYQDTNTAQDTLFEMLSNGKNRFMVGDVKQSIYRFRLAMPQIFNDKKDSFKYFESGEECINRKIIFDKNFRSSKEICEFTNFVFSNIMSRRVGELDYTDEEFLNYDSNAVQPPSPCVQLNVINVPEGEDADEFEARRIAKCINDMVNSGALVRENNILRKVRYGDFAVLLRSTKNRIDTYSKTFAAFGIPVTANNRTNLFENNEVAILVSLLRVIDNPTLDVELLATLMSVFYGYSADEIALAKINNKGNNLYSSICADKKTFSAFLADLEKYRRYAASMSVESFIRQIISDSAYLSVISAMGNYEQRRLNVMKLIALAKRFDEGESVGLTVFLRFVDSIIENKISYESADLSGIDENCVQIMSVHKSKGLEFPVCILAGTSHKYNNDDLKSLVLINEKYGIGLKVTNEQGLYRYNSLQYNIIKNLNNVASMSENLRVLYVAITRAKDYLITFSSFNNAAEHINSISKKLFDYSISSNVVKKTTNDADLLLLCALLHPDCGNLRNLCVNRINHLPLTNSKISVNIIDEDAENNISAVNEVPYNKELLSEISEKLSFEYAGRELSGFSSKRTASSLDDKEQSYKFFASRIPSFITGGELSGTEKGTAMHSFMQYCSYENSFNNIENEIERLQAEGYLTEIQAKALNRKKLNEFFGSEIAKRMFSSDKLYRELKVSSFVPINELEDTKSDEPVLVQGIADCVFEENGELVLVDYKTDCVNSENELLELYKNQIGFYKNAVSKALQMPVKETMLYSFYLGKCCVYNYF